MQPATQPGPSLSAARANTDELFHIVREDSLYDRPIAERHRIIFYIGHLEAFDWNLLRQFVDAPQFDARLDRLFAFGIDPAVGHAKEDRPSDWPKLDEVQRYVRRAREAVDARLADVPESVVHVALEHRLMHSETLAYMLHNLPFEKKLAPPRAAHRTGATPERVMLDIPAGEATLGRRRGEGFGWDNEFDEHTVHVPAFRISKHKVTNGEYLEYVRAGGPAPHFWVRESLVRGMFEDIPLPLDWPVYVSHREAEAYATWAGMSLPTEAEFHRAAYATIEGYEPEYSWGDAPPRAIRGNFDFASWDPIPVTATPEGDSAFGVSQLTGNGWEWTATVFAPFPGFEPFPFYPGYSADFFDGEHFVLKGGSARTAAPLLRRSFRNWFRPDYPYVYSGFRLVER